MGLTARRNYLVSGETGIGVKSCRKGRIGNVVDHEVCHFFRHPPDAFGGYRVFFYGRLARNQEYSECPAKELPCLTEKV